MEIGAADQRERLQTALGGAYTLEREVGRGGMATVYRAHDHKHGRPVAVKVLHAELAAALGPERFLQEIRLLAALQHPHILGLIDSGVVAEDADGLPRGRPFYVMPYVDGETLRQQLAREGPLPVSDAVRLATEVASALDYAHRHGVVHRDVKPENILLHDGSALVADFGIALAVEQAGGARLTQTGLSLGTPQYMSPEQAAGEKLIDARTDVYALGAVTYEMLAGEPPFTGHNTQAIVARALTEAPRALSAQRPSVPPSVAAAVHRALEKLPADRFATTAEFARALRDNVDVGTVGTSVRAVGGRDARTGTLVGALALVAAASIALALWGWLRPPAVPVLPAVTAAILPPPGETFMPGALGLALSPDGTQLAIVVQREAPRPRLFVRRLATGEMRLLPGSQNALAPFWSPDGREIGFSADGKLRTTPAAGGPVTVVCDLPAGTTGATWAPDGAILFSSDPGGVVFRVSHTGGTPVAITRRGPEPPHVQPTLLPDGTHFLYGTRGDGGVYVGDLRTGAGRMILRDATRATYVAPGYLLYDVGTRLVARRYDARRDSVTGEPVTVAEGVLRVGGTTWAASPTGVLVYLQSSGDSGRIVVDRRGVVIDSIPPDGVGPFALSHDGTRVAQGPWVRDLRRGAPLKLPLSVLFIASVAWSPDDTRLAFTGVRDNSRRDGIVVRQADGLGDELRLDGPPGPPGSVQIADWTPDGTALLVTGATDSASAGRALWLVDLATGARRRWMTVAGRIQRAKLSPDGRWLAYQSDETGAPEVYLRPFPGAGAPVRASVAGGAFPTWRGDGRELFYLTPEGDLMTLAVAAAGSAAAELELPAPRLLARALVRAVSSREVAPATYVPMPDGQRFLVRDTRRGDRPLTLVAPWTSALRVSMP